MFFFLGSCAALRLQLIRPALSLDVIEKCAIQVCCFASLSLISRIISRIKDWDNVVLEKTIYARFLFLRSIRWWMFWYINYTRFNLHFAHTHTHLRLKVVDCFLHTSATVLLVLMEKQCTAGVLLCFSFTFSGIISENKYLRRWMEWRIVTLIDYESKHFLSSRLKVVDCFLHTRVVAWGSFPKGFRYSESTRTFFRESVVVVAKFGGVSFWISFHLFIYEFIAQDMKCGWEALQLTPALYFFLSRFRSAILLAPFCCGTFARPDGKTMRCRCVALFFFHI